MTTPLRLIIDGRALVGNRTGIGVHTAEIASRLEITPAPLIASHRDIDERSGIEHCRFRADRAINGVMWQQTKLARVARLEAADVLWGPHSTLPMRLETPAVVSAHDLTSMTMPHLHRLSTIASFNLLIRQSLERATSIAAVSQKTADEIIQAFGLPSRKIHVVYNGVSEFFSPAAGDPDLPAGLDAGEPFLLYVGTVEPRKGIDDLIDAWERLGSRPRLVVCGDRGWGSRRLRVTMGGHERSGELLRTGFIPREQLRALYRNATLVVYPSHDEGFGLPVVEAMACGAALVATHAGAIPEIAGDGARLIAPGDRHALLGALEELLASEPARRELAARGLARARLFRWERAASAMLELFVDAASR